MVEDTQKLHLHVLLVLASEGHLAASVAAFEVASMVVVGGEASVVASKIAVATEEEEVVVVLATKVAVALEVVEVVTGEIVMAGTALRLMHQLVQVAAATVMARRAAQVGMNLVVEGAPTTTGQVEASVVTTAVVMVIVVDLEATWSR